jgi:hypothetical protein
MNLRSILSAAGVLGAAFGAQALSITSLTPQGEVAQVRQVVAKFDGLRRSTSAIRRPPHPSA